MSSPGHLPVLSRSLRWIGRHRKLTACAVLAINLLLLNIVAYNHAYSMTHFCADGSRTPNPEALSFWEKAKVLFLGINIPRPINEKTPQDDGLTAETRRIASTKGVELEVWHIPHQQPRAIVLLAHGYAASKASLLREARAFHDMGCATCLVDFRGSGGSSGTQTTVGVDEADDVARVVEHLQSTSPQCPLILYGQSMGSVAILRAISQNGVRANAVIIESPFDRLLSTVENRFSAMGLPAFPGAPLLVFWGGVQQGFDGFSHNPVDYARNVECPVLILYGARDPRVSRDQIVSVYEALAGEKRLEHFAEAGHEPCINVDAEHWKRLVIQFLSESAR